MGIIMETKHCWNQRFLSILFLSLLGLLGGSQSLVCMKRKKGRPTIGSKYDKYKNIYGNYECPVLGCKRTYPNSKKGNASFRKHLTDKKGKCAKAHKRKREESGHDGDNRPTKKRRFNSKKRVKTKSNNDIDHNMAHSKVILYQYCEYLDWEIDDLNEELEFRRKLPKIMQQWKEDDEFYDLIQKMKKELNN